MSVTAISTVRPRETPGAGPGASEMVGSRHSARSGTAWLETAALMVIVILLFVGVFNSARPATTTPGLARLTVQAGDSLWTLAQAHPVEGLSTAQVADLIAETNGRDGALITPGETILVPTRVPEDTLAAR